MKSILRFLILCTLFCLHAASPSADAWAGASASQWVVVVNGDSHNSRTLANHYCQLRDIPGRNVIVLKEIPNSNTMPIDEFRSRILGPVLKEIEDRQLSTHIQGIAYSCDIPTTIELQSDLSSVENLPKVLTPTASINGLTYLFRWVMEKNPTYITPDSKIGRAHV